MDADRADPSVQRCVEAYIYAGRPPRFLILRRPPARGRIWVPVSGKVEPSDADLEAALRRELSEETGLDHPRRVHRIDWSVEFDGPDGRRWRLFAFGVELDGETVPTLSAEHDAFEWVDPPEAIARLHYEDNRTAVLLTAEAVRSAPSPPTAPSL